MLYRIHVDHARSGRRREVPTEPEAMNAAGSQPASQEHHVECRNIGDALDLLPADQRSAILLIALEGFTYDEAAEVLNVPIGTVRSRLSRGREALREFRKDDAPPRILRRVK